MTSWSDDELTAIDGVEDLRLESLRQDGSTRKPVVMWVVRLEDDLYVRAVGGRTSPWFRGTQSQHAGGIRAGGVEKQVRFSDPSDDLGDALDAAYRAKYGRYATSIVDQITIAVARSATLRLDPMNP